MEGPIEAGEVGRGRDFRRRRIVVPLFSRDVADVDDRRLRHARLARVLHPRLQRPADEVFQGTFPHFIAHLIAIAILVAFPEIILRLPSKMIWH
jgi:hypothetical protein